MERPLPSNIDTERLVLGSIILNPDTFFDRAANMLRVEDFSLEKHRRIFARMGEIHARGEGIDRITVANELMRYSELESVGGLSYLASLDDGLPEVPSLDGYLRIIKDKSALRALIAIGHKAVGLSHEQNLPPGKIIQDLSKALLHMELKLGGRKTLLNTEDILEEHGGLDGFFQFAIKPGISTGFPQIDDAILGLQEGCHYVIGGATGSGKTTLAENIAMNVAKAGYPVAIFSLEMSKEMLLARAVCSEAKIPFRAYIKNQLMSDQRLAAMRAIADIQSAPLYIDDYPGMTINDFATRVDRAVAQHKVRLIVLDYLQIISGDTEMRLKNEYEIVTLASKTCRMLARKHGISSIALSQLKRGEKRNKGERPTLSDLKATGGIENDAAAVVLMYREELYFPGKQEIREQADAIIAKARAGSLGTKRLRFLGRYYRFEDEGEQHQEVDD